jgi:hypothetical protein
MVAVAQLVESRIVIPVVAGSSPVGHPKRIKLLAQFNGLGFLLSGVDVGAGQILPANASLP